MAYSTSIENLLSVLSDKAPAKADAIKRNLRTVQYGKLTVGIKLHIIGRPPELLPLLEALDARQEEVLDPNYYQKVGSSWCMVLPPVGNVNVAIDLLLAIEQYCEYAIFNNPAIHIQVCSPGLLGPRLSAAEAISFYLSSDTLRRYAPEDLETTFTSSPVYPRGKRLVLYDARGTFEREFPWWGGVEPDLTIHPELPFTHERTDILVGPGSQIDIKNINLIATLLTHYRYDGYWQKLGARFLEEVHELLQQHKLYHLLNAPWVYTRRPQSRRDDLFLPALQELVAYVFEEAATVAEPRRNFVDWVLPRRWRHIPKRKSANITVQMRNIVINYQEKLVHAAREHTSRGGKT